MRRSTWWVTMGAALAVLATSPIALAENSQQAKMTSCNADAKAQGLKGDDRKTFMKNCLSAKGAASAPSDATAKPAAAGVRAARREASRPPGRRGPAAPAQLVS